MAAARRRGPPRAGSRSCPRQRRAVALARSRSSEARSGGAATSCARTPAPLPAGRDRRGRAERRPPAERWSRRRAGKGAGGSFVSCRLSGAARLRGAGEERRRCRLEELRRPGLTPLAGHFGAGARKPRRTPVDPVGVARASARPSSTSARAAPAPGPLAEERGRRDLEPGRPPELRDELGIAARKGCARGARRPEISRLAELVTSATGSGPRPHGRARGGARRVAERSPAAGRGREESESGGSRRPAAAA